MLKLNVVVLPDNIISGLADTLHVGALPPPPPPTPPPAPPVPDGLIVKESSFVAVLPPPSVTVTVMEWVPSEPAAGVPVIVLPLHVIPFAVIAAGQVMPHEYEESPPVALMVAE